MISQLERLNFQRNENCTKLGMDRGQWFGLSATTFMVSSKMDGSDSHFDAEAIITHNTSWDLEKDDVQADPIVVSGKADTNGQV